MRKSENLNNTKHACMLTDRSQSFRSNRIFIESIGKSQINQVIYAYFDCAMFFSLAPMNTHPNEKKNENSLWFPSNERSKVDLRQIRQEIKFIDFLDSTAKHTPDKLSDSGECNLCAFCFWSRYFCFTCNRCAGCECVFSGVILCRCNYLKAVIRAKNQID